MSMVPTSPAQTRVHIRWMIRRDMPEVLAIEHASFEYPWCEEEFLRVLRQRNCIGMVAEHGERIVGFMIYELHRNKIHVLDFATPSRIPAPRHRATNGREACRKAFHPAPEPHRTLTSGKRIFRPSFSSGSWDFRAMEVVREHYLDTGEDAYSMQYHMDESVVNDDHHSDESDRQAIRCLRLAGSSVCFELASRLIDASSKP